MNFIRSGPGCFSKDGSDSGFSRGSDPNPGQLQLDPQPWFKGMLVKYKKRRRMVWNQHFRFIQVEGYPNK